ncbi:MAG: hypothetical protein JSV78_06905 [Phycisphaerales bacterium]|nr:MAG: hypothetical protein JSV78_06905 [Phycisphaerales bacterium]
MSRTPTGRRVLVRDVAQLRACRRLPMTALALCAAILPGCPPRQPMVPPDPIPMDRAIETVNANSQRISTTLRARGPVTGHFTTPEGDKKSYDLDGFLFYLPPRNLRFNLKSIAGSEFLVGSNETHYWFVNERESYYYCRPHGESRMVPDGHPLPVRPDQMIEALGLSRIEPEGTLGPAPVHRVVNDYQQLLFVTSDASERIILEKEYWLDRRPPRLVRRIIFRNAEGIVEMDSRLSEYRRLGSDGPMVPRLIEVSWPAEKSALRFRINRWQTEDRVSPDGPQFTPPHKLGIRYEHEDIVE